MDEDVELVCIKDGKKEKRMVKRSEVKAKIKAGWEKGWNCTPYQKGFYKEF